MKNFYISLGNLRWIFIYTLLLGIISCGYLNPRGFKAIGAQITPINQLKSKQKPDIVYIQGKVEKAIPLVKKQAYQVNDGTGKIWIVSNQTGIKQGESLLIKGKISYRSIPLGGKEYGELYVEEE